jgi:hypothetical protein
MVDYTCHLKLDQLDKSKHTIFQVKCIYIYYKKKQQKTLNIIISKRKQ